MSDTLEELADLLREHVPGETLNTLMRRTKCKSVTDVLRSVANTAPRHGEFTVPEHPPERPSSSPSGSGRRFRADEIELVDHLRTLNDMGLRKLRREVEAKFEALREAMDERFKVVLDLQMELRRLKRGSRSSTGPVRL